MALAISTPASFLHSSSSSSGKTSPICSFSTPTISIPRNVIFPQLRFAPLSQWNGLKHMGISISHYSVKMERKGKGKGKGICASLFGVGAPEVLVIGVVALLVFGPKGLAEVARNLGQTLRAFQPTIKELQEVSREFKSTLEREIGLDEPEPRSSSFNTPKPTPEGPDTNIEPNGSSANDELTAQGDRFKQALAQLQKSQEEEILQKEEKAEKEAELITTSQDTSQALHTPDGTSSVEDHKEGGLQEAASVASSGSQAPKDEAQV